MTLYTHDLRIEDDILYINGKYLVIEIMELGGWYEMKESWWNENKPEYTKVTDNPKTIAKLLRLQGMCFKEMLDTADSV